MTDNIQPHEYTGMTKDVQDKRAWKRAARLGASQNHFKTFQIVSKSNVQGADRIRAQYNKCSARNETESNLNYPRRKAITFAHFQKPVAGTKVDTFNEYRRAGYSRK